MKKLYPLAIIAILCTTLTSCEIVTGIFKAGAYAGAFVVIIILAFLIWLATKIFGGNKNR